MSAEPQGPPYQHLGIQSGKSSLAIRSEFTKRILAHDYSTATSRRAGHRQNLHATAYHQAAASPGVYTVRLL